MRLGNNNKITRLLISKAKTHPKKIVYPEADKLDVIKAAQIVHEEGIGIPILLGNRERIEKMRSEIEYENDVEIIDLSESKH